MSVRRTLAGFVLLAAFTTGGFVPSLTAQTLKEKWDKTTSLMQQGKMAEALDVLNHMLADTALAMGNRAAVLFRMGFIQTDLKEYEASIATYKQLLKLSPRNPSAWGNLGWNEYLIGKVQDAINSTEKAVEIDSTLAFAHANLGLYALALGKQDDAMPHYSKACRHLKDADSMNGILADLDDIEKSKPEYEEIVQKLRQMVQEAGKGIATKP